MKKVVKYALFGGFIFELLVDESAEESEGRERNEFFRPLLRLAFERVEEVGELVGRDHFQFEKFNKVHRSWDFLVPRLAL
jgi:hypothetical protein